MDIDFAPEDEAFRPEVRSFIEENYRNIWSVPTVAS